MRLSADTRPVVRRHYRAQYVALWTKLIPKLHRSDSDDDDPCYVHLLDDAHDPTTFDNGTRVIACAAGHPGRPLASSSSSSFPPSHPRKAGPSSAGVSGVVVTPVSPTVAVGDGTFQNVGGKAGHHTSGNAFGGSGGGGSGQQKGPRRTGSAAIAASTSASRPIVDGGHRPTTTTRPSSPVATSKAVGVGVVASSAAASTVDYNAALIITVAAGCVLLSVNIILFACLYCRRRLRSSRRAQRHNGDRKRSLTADVDGRYTTETVCMTVGGGVVPIPPPPLTAYDVKTLTGSPRGGGYTATTTFDDACRTTTTDFELTASTGTAAGTPTAGNGCSMYVTPIPSHHHLYFPLTPTVSNNSTFHAP